MDRERSERLRKMLENGEISQEMYDEILKRWNQSGQGEKDGGNEEKEKEGSTDRSDRVEISGSGKFSAIYSKSVSVSGFLTVEGDLDSEGLDVSGGCIVHKNLLCSGVLKSSGSIRIEGNMTAGNVDSSGSIRVNGSVNSGELELSGLLTARSLTCTDGEISGSARIEENIEANTLDSSGSLTAKAIKCTTLKSSGSTKCENIGCEDAYILGKIESKSIISRTFNMEIYNANSNVGELRAEVVNIEARRRRFLAGEASFQKIICKKAQMEFTTAKYVYGDEIFIGEGCKIDYVEARSITVSEKAKVKEKKIITM
ncbi:hypothetical protein ACNF40_08715 [Cuniculiplasma sp. SKW4]|uniref:hypothetical protein n=1 Tax=Cuniculiplasma sp. SKW4 TaxID=3400171 RepID=UPI003FD5E434